MDPVMDGLVPITVVAIIFTTLSAVAIVLIFAAIKKRKMEIDAYKAAIEKGLSVPEFKIRTSEKSPINTLRSALVWMACGLGFTIMMYLIALEERDFSPMGVGAIPFLIGVALVISYVIEKKEREKEKSNT